jgi:hypothetical protein
MNHACSSGPAMIHIGWDRTQDDEPAVMETR